MESRNRKIEDLYLTLRNIFFRSLMPLTRAYTKSDLLDISTGKILVIRLDRIGDMVMTTPIFRALKEEWLDAQITVLTNPVNKNLVIKNPFVDCILVYDKHGCHRSLISRLSFFKQIREKNFDIIIDPYFDYELGTSIITRLVGSRYRLGFEYAGREIFYNIRCPSDIFPVFTEGKHMIEHNLDLIASLGVRVKKRQPEIFVSEDEKESAYQLLKSKGINPENKIIGIHPGGHYDSQRWSIERFASISDYLINNHGVNVLLFGGKPARLRPPASPTTSFWRVPDRTGHSGGDERNLILEFKSFAEKTPFVFEGLELREFITVLSHCDLLLCNNSGPLHIATALNIPTVSTMGPTVPFHWWPRGENHVVLRKDLDCSPCKKGICKTHECMKLIATDDFLAAVKRQIKILDFFHSEEASDCLTTNKSLHN